MAENPLIGGTAAFALGTLSKAAGQDFLSPMLNDVRTKDLFLFQQREAVRLREEARKRDKEERKASRRGLVSALQATGSVLPEDIAAAGGVDTISDLDDTEFDLLTTRLSDQQAQRLSDADLESSLRGMLPAIGLPPLGPGPHSRSQLLELKAQADMNLLMKREGVQQRDETTRAMRTTVGQAARDIGAMFERPQAVTVDTLRQAFGRHQQAAARLASVAGDLSDADYENLQDDLNSMADEIRRQQVHVGLNNLARGSPTEIIAGLTQLDPDQRTLALERPSIAAAWSRVEFAANQLVGLGEEGAGKLGLGELYQQALEGDPAQDGPLAQSLAAAAGKISEGPRVLKQREAAEAGMAEAKATAAAAASLGFAGDVPLEPYINPKTGDFDRGQFLRDKYSEPLMQVESMDPVQAQDFLTTLAAVGAPADMQRLAAKGAQRGLERAVGETWPENLLDLSTQRGQIERQEDTAHAALGELLTLPPGTTDMEYVNPEEAAHGLRNKRRQKVSPEYLAKLRGAVDATGAPLAEQRVAVESWGQALIEKIKDARQSGDAELAGAYESAAQEQQLLLLSLQTRGEVRADLAGMLKGAAPFFGEFKGGAGGTDEATKAGVLQAFGLDADKAAEGAPKLNDVESVFAALREQALAKLKNRTTEQGAAEAVSAELDRLYELTLELDGALQDPATLKLYRQTGIVRGQSGDLPALELLAYFL